MVDDCESICGSVGSTDDKPRNELKKNNRKLTNLEKNGLLDVFLVESTAVKIAIDSRHRKIMMTLNSKTQSGLQWIIYNGR